MTTLTVELNINGHKHVVPHAVTIEVDEIVGLPFGEARRYADEKVRQWIAEAVKATWTVDLLPVAVPERKQAAA